MHGYKTLQKRHRSLSSDEIHRYEGPNPSPAFHQHSPKPAGAASPRTLPGPAPVPPQWPWESSTPGRLWQPLPVLALPCGRAKWWWQPHWLWTAWRSTRADFSQLPRGAEPAQRAPQKSRGAWTDNQFLGAKPRPASSRNCLWLPLRAVGELDIVSCLEHRVLVSNANPKFNHRMCLIFG